MYSPKERKVRDQGGIRDSCHTSAARTEPYRKVSECNLMFQSTVHAVAFIFQPWHLSTGEQLCGAHAIVPRDTRTLPLCTNSSPLSPPPRALHAELDAL